MAKENQFESWCLMENAFQQKIFIHVNLVCLHMINDSYHNITQLKPFIESLRWNLSIIKFVD